MVTVLFYHARSIPVIINNNEFVTDNVLARDVYKPAIGNSWFCVIISHVTLSLHSMYSLCPSLSFTLTLRKLACTQLSLKSLSALFQLNHDSAHLCHKDWCPTEVFCLKHQPWHPKCSQFSVDNNSTSSRRFLRQCWNLVEETQSCSVQICYDRDTYFRNTWLRSGKYQDIRIRRLVSACLAEKCNVMVVHGSPWLCYIPHVLKLFSSASLAPSQHHFV